jgi:hypothetical protein
MINMLTVGAFGNDMAAAPSLVGLAAASSASDVRFVPKADIRDAGRQKDFSSEVQR